MIRFVHRAVLAAALLLASAMCASYSTGYATASPWRAPEPANASVYVRDNQFEDVESLVSALLTRIGQGIREILDPFDNVEPNDILVTTDELLVEVPEHNTSSLGNLGRNFLG
eukprot:2523141-Amphidinium_carterae.1